MAASTPELPHRRETEGPLRQASLTLTVPTRGPGLYECTEAVIRWSRQTGITEGLLTIFIQHTSASLLLQENADPDVRADLEAFFARLVPESPGQYRHQSEGPDDMPAHIRGALTQTHLSIPVESGSPSLGVWQGIFVFEHRRSAHTRQIRLHLIGN
jgi:secondary thiamine-phosphate synthase enzyme